MTLANIEHMFGQQESLFSVTAEAVSDPRPDRSFDALSRRDLADGAWLDHAPGWLEGDARLFDELSTAVDWAQPDVEMYDRVVTTPRLVARMTVDEHPVLSEIADALSERYGRRMDRISANWYRNGDDSVAWHGDRVARDRHEAVVATVSLRGPREFRFRPAVGGASDRISLGHGDLVVMGGTFQRTWRHAIPKTSGPVAPRMVVMFRHAYD